MSMNPVVHFEMPREDTERVSKFYRDVFGWDMQMMGKEMNDYIVATTTDSDAETGRPKEPGAINGGFFPKDAVNKPAQYPSVVISVDDIHEHIKKINEAGGEVLGEPVDIPGIGWYVSFMDSEGNRVSILQAKPR